MKHRLVQETPKRGKIPRNIIKKQSKKSYRKEKWQNGKTM
jgi:hypothetical protein